MNQTCNSKVKSILMHTFKMFCKIWFLYVRAVFHSTLQQMANYNIRSPFYSYISMNCIWNEYHWKYFKWLTSNCFFLVKIYLQIVLHQSPKLVSKFNAADLNFLDFLFVIIALYMISWWIYFGRFCHTLKLLERMSMCSICASMASI